MGERFKQMLSEHPDVVEMIKREPAYKQRQIAKINLRNRVMKYAEKAKERAEQITTTLQ